MVFLEPGIPERHLPIEGSRNHFPMAVVTFIDEFTVMRELVVP